MDRAAQRLLRRGGVQLIGDAPTSGVIEAPADGTVSWTAHADLAEAAAIVLADEGRFDGPTPPLTAGEALDLRDMAAVAADLLGWPVERRTISDDEQRARMAARGAPAAVVAIALGLYAASRRGEFSAVDPALEGLLGRPRVTMRQVMADAIAG